MEEKDKGFTLIELLVVIIIIGILSAIAIPIFLNQRKKAVDTAARADVSTIAKQVATYFVDNDSQPTLAITTDGTYTLTSGETGAVAQNIGPRSRSDFTTPPSIVPAVDASAEDFCVQLVYPGGDHTTVSYDALKGAADAACS